MSGIVEVVIAIEIFVNSLLGRPHLSSAAIVPPPERAVVTHPPAAPRPARAGSVTGWASYYDWRPGQAAAGPALRRLLGVHWRGRVVQACAGARCVRLRLTDWCQCGPRHGRPTVIDIDRRSFPGSLSQGIVIVTVSG